jgi:hypothetical protein
MSQVTYYAAVAALCKQPVLSILWIVHELVTGMSLAPTCNQHLILLITPVVVAICTWPVPSDW